jgi:hypothetical protein
MLLLDDMMTSFHHNGAFFIDSLRESNGNGTGGPRSNLFPFYGFHDDEVFEFEHVEEDNDEYDTICLNTNFQGNNLSHQQSRSCPVEGDSSR